jgi:hypothetical protein
MPSDSQSTANYAAVILDLKAKRDELNRAISVLEAMTSQPPQEGRVAVGDLEPDSTRLTVAKAREVAEARSRRAKELIPTPLPSLGIGDACVHILRTRDGALLSTRQVTNLLLGGGFELNVLNPINNVWSALAHRARTKGDVERIGRNWRYADPEKPQASDAVEVERPHLNGATPH